MIIRWLEDAIYDLQALRQYIALDSAVAANSVAQRIISAVETLVDQPGIGRPGKVPDSRELIVSGTPYIIPYRVQNNIIEVLRVFHGAMQWSETL